MKRTPLRRRAKLRARKQLQRHTSLQRTPSMAATVGRSVSKRCRLSRPSGHRAGNAAGFPQGTSGSYGPAARCPRRVRFEPTEQQPAPG